MYEGKDISEEEIITKANKCIREFKHAISSNIQSDKDNINNFIPNSKIQPNTPNSRNKRWRKPYPRTVKYNCDASLTQDGLRGLGAAIRDEHGGMLASTTRLEHGFAYPEVTIYKSVQLAINC